MEEAKKKPSRKSHVITLLVGIFGAVISCTVFGSPIGAALSVYGIVRTCISMARNGGITLMEQTGFIFSVIGVPLGIFLTLTLFGL